MEKNKTVMCVVGARPNFMKIAPLMAEFNKENSQINAVLVHTGQHYDEAMKKTFFDQLGIPKPDVDLGVGSGSHAIQTADIMKKFEPEVDKHNPAAVLVVGDVNSTVACGLVAAKKNIPVIHVEAGLRSRDRTMPEEINRILTDQLSDLLYTTEREAADNLAQEGIAGDKVQFVGNVMIDTLRNNLNQATPAQQIFANNNGGEKFTGEKESYAILTLHRPSNVDDEVSLRSLLETMNTISKRIPIVFPVHPRTASKIEMFGLEGLLQTDSILRIPPAGYLDMLGLMQGAKVVLTDSGGVQEETTALGIPCITLRESTERPITATDGTNTIVGADRDLILKTFDQVMEGKGKAGRIPEYWDGNTAKRIAAHLSQWLEQLP